MVGTGATVALLAPRAPMPPFLPLGDYGSYGPDTPAALVALEPLVHAPWFGPVGPAVAVVVCILVLRCLVAASQTAGATAWAGAVTAVAFAVRPDIGVALACGGPALLATALLWASGVAAASTAWPRLATIGVAAASVTAAGALWPPIAILTPVLAGVALDRRRYLLALALVGSAVVGVIAGGALWAARATAMTGEAVTLVDVWSLIVNDSGGAGSPYPWPPLSVALLPGALAAVGACDAWWRRAHRAATVVAAAVVMATIVGLPAWRAEAVRAVYWAAWPLAAVGLTWLVAHATKASRATAVAGLSVVLIGTGLLASRRQTELVEPAAFAAALAAALAHVAGDGVTVVAEDPRLDTALVAWGGDRVHRVRPRPPAIEAAAAVPGRPVLAGPTARRALETWGFRFVAAPSVTAPVAYPLSRLAGGFRCLAVGTRWSELSGLEYTGRLGVHVPAGAGHLELVVAGPPPLVMTPQTLDGRALGQTATREARALDALPGVLWPGDGRLPAPDTVAQSTTVPASASGPIDGVVSLGARAPLVAARMVGASAEAEVCAAPLPRFDPLDDADAVALPLDDDVSFAGGWYGIETFENHPFRWSAGRAVVLVASSRARRVAIGIDASPAAPGPVALTLRVNGVDVGDHAMVAGIQTFTWTASPSVWVDGTNEIAFEVRPPTRPSEHGGTDGRELGLALHRLRISRQ